MIDRYLITELTRRFYTEEEYNDVEEFFKTRSKSSSVQTALENIKRNIFFIKENYNEIKKYFE